MNEMRNYNVYIKGMEMGFQEKLFFLDHVELDDYDTIIDFGWGRETYSEPWPTLTG